MRTIFIILMVGFLQFNTHAANWMNELDIAKVNTGQVDTTVYMKRSKCPGLCFDISGKDLRRNSLQLLQVDDLSKPLYGSKLKSQSGFLSLQLCQEAEESHCDDQTPGYDVRPVCADELPASTFELYCVAKTPQSYKQKMVKVLAKDAALKATADAADGAKTQLKADLVSEKSAVRVALQGWDSLTEAQRMRAMKRILRLLLRE